MGLEVEWRHRSQVCSLTTYCMPGPKRVLMPFRVARKQSTTGTPKFESQRCVGDIFEATQLGAIESDEGL